MSGVHDDLATLLRRCINQSRATYVPGTPENYPAAELRGLSILDAERVEAEVARLREERLDAVEKCAGWIERAEAAEARCARLQQALREIEKQDGRYSDLNTARYLARQALAELDTPAEDDEEPCPFCGFAGPFDGHVCEPVLCGCGDPENCRYATPEEHAGLDTPADSQEDKT